MALINDDAEGVKVFKWKGYEKIFCEVCLKYIMHNGHGSNFKWNKISEMLEDEIKIKVTTASCKNKFDHMKKRWKLWKTLLLSETGLGWDPTTGQLSCSNEWWEKKIAENPEVKAFRNKSPGQELSDLWAQLFDDSCANGWDNVSPSIDPPTNMTMNVEEAKENEEIGANENDMNKGTGNIFEDAFSEYNHYDQLLDSDNNFNEFLNEVRVRKGAQELNRSSSRNQVPNLESTEGDSNKRPTKQASKSVRPKRKRRRSGGGSAILAASLNSLLSNSNEALEIMKTENHARPQVVSDSSIDTGMSIIGRMVNEGTLEEGSDLWCFAHDFISDETKRNIFVNMKYDNNRKVWLDFMSRNK